MRLARPSISTMLVAILAVVGGASPALADCSADPEQSFHGPRATSVIEAERIRSVFFGRVVKELPPRADPAYTVRVGRWVAGARVGPTVTWGPQECGSMRLPVGRVFLFATTRTGIGPGASMIFEIDGPAWRSVVWPRTGVTLDGRRAPTDPDALLRFLEERIGGLPDTATAGEPAPAASVGPDGPGLAVMLGIAGGVLLVRRRRLPIGDSLSRRR